MEWQLLNTKLVELKLKFDKSNKCLTQNRKIKNATISKHATILVECFNQARSLIHDNREKLNTQHWSYVSRFLQRLQINLNNIKTKYSLDITIPTILNTPVVLEENKDTDFDTDLEEIDSENIIKQEDLHDLTIPAVIILPEPSESESEPEIEQTINMAMTQLEYLKLASSILPEFDGKAENLTSFIDGLSLIDSMKGSYETVAISLIKTKLKGHARKIITNEVTITEIIDKLKIKVKGESVEVISAKLLNLQQKQKTAIQYVQEVEKLTKALEGAYIDDGLTSEIAAKYSTAHAVKAMVKNCSIDRVKYIMEAGTFSTMDEATSKFVNSCTEATGHANSVLYFSGQQNKNYGNRGGYRGRVNYNNNGNRRYNNNNRGGGQYRGNYRGRGNSSRGHGNNNPSNVRVTQSNSENSQTPLGTQN